MDNCAEKKQKQQRHQEQLRLQREQREKVRQDMLRDRQQFKQDLAARKEREQEQDEDSALRGEAEDASDSEPEVAKTWPRWPAAAITGTEQEAVQTLAAAWAAAKGAGDGPPVPDD